MNNDLSTTDTLAEFFKMHPFISFITCICVMSANLSESIYSLQLPIIIMQIGQLLAWGCVCITGAITIYGFLEKKLGLKIKFFKKKKE